MRLHILRLRAFGPFPGEVEVDVDAVAASGLFLIRGATGAGKTSLLDAVCFALYADVPGARSRKGLHSHHATAGHPPRVELEFTAVGRRFRIERSPEFTRPSKRAGGKPVTVPAKAALFERGSLGWRELSARHDEIADTLRQVLGMGLEQFSKVVLLPQGDFAAFLRATPEERRGLLERLFDISTFAGIEEWLADRRRESATALAASQSALESHVARLADTLTDVPQVLTSAPTDWRSLEPSQVPGELQRVCGALEAHAVQTLADLDSATSVERSAVAAHQDGRRVTALQAKARQARERLEVLEKGRGVQKAAVAAIERATRAAAVGGELRALARAKAATQEAALAVTSLAVDIARFGLDERDDQAVAAWAERLAAHDDTLADAERCVAAVLARENRRREVSAILAQQRRSQDQAATEVSAADRALAAAGRELEASVAAEGRLVAEEAELARLSGLLTVRRQHELGVAARAAALEERSAARAAEQDARELLLDLREARLAGMAGELAEALSPGGACPVCGSCEHPEPAQRHAPVTPHHIAAAEAAWTAARDALQGIERRLAALDAAAGERSRALGDDSRTAAQLSESVSEARAKLAASREHAHRSADLRDQRDAAMARLERVSAQAVALRDAMVSTQATLVEITDTSVADRRRVVAALREHAFVCPCVAGEDGCAGLPQLPETAAADDDAAAVASAAGADAEHLAERVRAAAEAHRRASRAVRLYRGALGRQVGAAENEGRALAAAEEALAEHGFATATEAAAASLPRHTLAELQRQAADYHRAITTVEAVLADPEVLEAEGQPAPDLDALAVAEAAARQQLMVAKDGETLARRTVRDLDRLKAALQKLCDAHGPALAEHEVLRELADTTGGTGTSNSRRMRLSAFVLAARLEKVVALANERLATMGDGRYRLRHTDSLAGRGARSGLGLEVEDLWTGQTRDTSSLSGGESFIASLALALGLADAVREESGGFDLQTLFVDEGFGTLDDESLEQVMDVLDDLREGGRAVGVVSHVAELRTRIPSQVVVHKTEHGSTLRVTSSDASAPAA